MPNISELSCPLSLFSFFRPFCILQSSCICYFKYHSLCCHLWQLSLLGCFMKQNLSCDVIVVECGRVNMTDGVCWFVCEQVLMKSNLGRVQVELYKEIKKNGPPRCLRAALWRFAELAYLILPQKCRYCCLALISSASTSCLCHVFLSDTFIFPQKLPFKRLDWVVTAVVLQFLAKLAKVV